MTMILAIDQEPIMTGLYTDIFGEESHQVITASSIQAALSQLAKLKFDLAVVELSTPRSDSPLNGDSLPAENSEEKRWPGLEILRRIRSGEFASAGNGPEMLVAVTTISDLGDLAGQVANYRPLATLNKPDLACRFMNTCLKALGTPVKNPGQP